MRILDNNVKIVEENFNQLVRRMRIPVKIIYTPDPYNKDHGQYIPADNIIIIYDSDPEKAYETLIHEILEYRLYPLIKKYKILINKLISFYDEALENEKDMIFESLIKDFEVLMEADMLPHPRNPRPKKPRARGESKYGGEKEDER